MFLAFTLSRCRANFPVLAEVIEDCMSKAELSSDLFFARPFGFYLVVSELGIHKKGKHHNQPLPFGNTVRGTGVDDSLLSALIDRYETRLT